MAVKQKEQTKVMLVNFDQKTADRVKQSTGLEVVLGYIGDHDTHEVDRDGNQEPSFGFKFPTPPYECAMVFVNLGNYAAAKRELGNKYSLWGKTESDNFLRYWKFKGTLLVFFVGDTNVGSMLTLGVPLVLTKSSGVDRQTNVLLGDDNPHQQLIEDIDVQLQMPNTKYILSKLSDTDYYRLGTEFYNLIGNANGDRLAAALTKANDDYHMQNPGLMVLPAVKQPSAVISKMIKHFAEHYKLKISDTEWLESDVFYPTNDIAKLTSEIDGIIKKAQQEVADRQQQINGIKASYAYLKDLLTEQGDALVDAVYKVLTELLGLPVTKSDELNSSNPKEDLLVEYNGQKILLEVKGTKRPNPPLNFPQQAAQHALRQGLKDVVSTGLVLNHDRETEPKERSLAYSDRESKELITDIHFIDVRTLHAVAIGVIEEKLEPGPAAAALFSQLGRAAYPAS